MLTAARYLAMGKLTMNARCKLPAARNAATPTTGLILRGRKNALSAFVAFAVLLAVPCSQASAQAGAGDDVPSAQRIWRHLLDNPLTEGEAGNNDTGPATARTTAVDGDRPSHRPVAQTDGASLARARVVIHHPSSSGEEVSQAVANRLRNAGAGEVEIRRVPFGIDQESIRFFFGADRGVSEDIGSLIAPERSAEVQDFTHYSPAPRRGTVEIWLR
jgi:hypothetical protein